MKCRVLCSNLIDMCPLVCQYVRTFQSLSLVYLTFFLTIKTKSINNLKILINLNIQLNQFYSQISLHLQV